MPRGVCARVSMVCDVNNRNIWLPASPVMTAAAVVRRRGECHPLQSVRRLVIIDRRQEGSVSTARADLVSPFLFLTSLMGELMVLSLVVGNCCKLFLGCVNVVWVTYLLVICGF